MTETTTTTTPVKPTPPKPDAKKPRDTLADFPGYPVASIRLKHQTDIPGNSSSDAVRSVKLGAKQWAIETVPALRAFRIVYSEQDKPPRTVYVPESNVLLFEVT